MVNKITKLLESKELPYLIAVLQSKVNYINSDAYILTDQNYNLVKRVKSMLELNLGKEIYFSHVGYPKGKIVKIKHRIILHSRELMKHIKKITRNNKNTPQDFTRKQQKTYLTGWFDARSCVSYSPHYIELLEWTLNYPRIVIYKENKKLLTSLYALLVRHSFSPRLNTNQIVLSRNLDVRRILDKKLILDKDKRECLEDMCKVFDDFKGKWEEPKRELHFKHTSCITEEIE